MNTPEISLYILQDILYTVHASLALSREGAYGEKVVCLSRFFAYRTYE